MKTIIWKNKKYILLQIIIIFLLVVFFNMKMKEKAIISTEELLKINANATIEEIDDYLGGHNDEFTYRKFLATYYATYVTVRQLDSLVENNKDSRNLDYLIAMNEVYGSLLSGEKIISNDLQNIKEAMIYMRDKNWEDELILFNYFQTIANEVDSR